MAISGQTIRMSPVDVAGEHDQMIGRHEWRWQVDPTDPANGNADVLLRETGYPGRIAIDEFGHMVLNFARLGHRVIFEPLPTTT